MKEIKYKFKTAQNSIEEKEILTLKEDRGNRVLVTSNYTESDLTIIPTFVYAKQDLVRYR